MLGPFFYPNKKGISECHLNKYCLTTNTSRLWLCKSCWLLSSEWTYFHFQKLQYTQDEICETRGREKNGSFYLHDLAMKIHNESQRETETLYLCDTCADHQSIDLLCEYQWWCLSKSRYIFITIITTTKPRLRDREEQTGQRRAGEADRGAGHCVGRAPWEPTQWLPGTGPPEHHLPAPHWTQG